jgi:hypothetical protein
MHWVDLYERLKRAFPAVEESEQVARAARDIAEEHGVASLKALVKRKKLQIRHISIGRRVGPYKRAPRILVDNVMVYGRCSLEMKLQLLSRDLSGLSGYAVAITPKPDTSVEKKLTQKTAIVQQTVPHGTWYISAVARDNNNNWSKLPGVLPYVTEPSGGN